MKMKTAFPGRFFDWILLLMLWGLPTGQAADSHTPAVAAAKVANPVKESDLATVTLTEAAERRLGIATATVETRKIRRTRLFGGEVVLPLAPAQGDDPGTGIRFVPDPPSSHAEVLRLAEMQAMADGEVQKAQVQLEAAKKSADRADKLVQTETGSRRALDDARAALQLAQATLEKARTQRALLGAPIAETSALTRVWIRVPIYAGDLPLLDSSKEAQVGGLADRPGSPTKSGRFAAGPRTADARAATVDWYYEVANDDRGLCLGQRVGVTLPLRGEEDTLVVPWAAVLHDIHGSQWVYQKTGPRTFSRMRVQVGRVVDGIAVLASGLTPGMQVVTDGAAELFGTEFGAGK